jgi:hypothetical protein
MVSRQDVMSKVITFTSRHEDDYGANLCVEVRPCSHNKEMPRLEEKFYIVLIASPKTPH